MPIHLTCMSWDCGRKPEYTERTHAGTRRTPHRKTCDVIKPRTSLLRGDGASHYTTVPPFLFNYSPFSLSIYKDRHSVPGPGSRSTDQLQHCKNVLFWFMTLTIKVSCVCCCCSRNWRASSDHLAEGIRKYNLPLNGPSKHPQTGRAQCRCPTHRPSRPSTSCVAPTTGTVWQPWPRRGQH